MGKVRIREQGFDPATPKVVEGTRLILKEIEYRYSVLPVDETAVHDMIRRCQSLEHRLYTAAGRSGKIVAAAEVNHAAGAEDAMIHNIAVEEAARGEGIGRTLIQHIAGHAAENGAETIHILPVDSGFFEHMGFVADPDDEAMMLASPADVLSA